MGDYGRRVRNETVPLLRLLLRATTTTITVLVLLPPTHATSATQSSLLTISTTSSTGTCIFLAITEVRWLFCALTARTALNRPGLAPDSFSLSSCRMQ